MCIHFRPGALGQGSRTALPICGLFLESVLKDKQFEKYRGKFPSQMKDVSITDFGCASYYHRQDTDSIEIDTLMTERIEQFDEVSTNSNQPSATSGTNHQTGTTESTVR